MPACELLRACRDLSFLGDTGASPSRAHATGRTLASSGGGGEPSLQRSVTPRHAVTIAVDENSVKFSTTGEMGTGNMTLRQNDSVDTKVSGLSSTRLPVWEPPRACSAQEEDRITIKMEEAVTLKFALRYLNFFTKVGHAAMEGPAGRRADPAKASHDSPPPPQASHNSPRRLPRRRRRCPAT